MGMRGTGLMVSLIDEEAILGVKRAKIKKIPDGLLAVVTDSGIRIGVAVEVELTESDYKRMEYLSVCKFQKSCTENIRSGFKNEDDLPVYSFSFKKH